MIIYCKYNKKVEFLLQFLNKFYIIMLKYVYCYIQRGFNDDKKYQLIKYAKI